uniref:Uncharacterized protein n=1 Tax=Anguilla anguilla TaxID=7936 RepID=A0A0E9PIQ0_ANGAN
MSGTRENINTDTK